MLCSGWSSKTDMRFWPRFQGKCGCTTYGFYRETRWAWRWVLMIWREGGSFSGISSAGISSTEQGMKNRWMNGAKGRRSKLIISIQNKLTVQQKAKSLTPWKLEHRSRKEAPIARSCAAKGSFMWSTKRIPASSRDKDNYSCELQATGCAQLNARGS